MHCCHTAVHVPVRTAYFDKENFSAAEREIKWASRTLQGRRLFCKRIPVTAEAYREILTDGACSTSRAQGQTTVHDHESRRLPEGKCERTVPREGRPLFCEHGPVTAEAYRELEVDGARSASMAQGQTTGQDACQQPERHREGSAARFRVRNGHCRGITYSGSGYGIRGRQQLL